MAESPEVVRTSLAAAITLKLEKGRFYRDAKLTGLNLLLTYENGCRANCSYCGLARERQAEEETFIRVKWPTYSLEEIIERSREAKELRRVCVGTITHPRALEDTRRVMERFREAGHLRISGLISPTLIRGREDLVKLRAAGAERLGIAIDTATGELFDRHRGQGVQGPHRWEKYWSVVKEAVAVFGTGMVGIHLVVGLGETEEEMVRTIQHAHDLGALTHLFSFYPEEGSRLEKASPPPIGQYRRVQLARYIINENLGRFEEMTFGPEGELLSFGRDVEPFLVDGAAFQTSGCPDHQGRVDCNRPYGNERPSEPIRNFPFPPTAEDLAEIRLQLAEGLTVSHVGAGR